MKHFEPSVTRARSLRRAMDEALWSSARSLLEELGESSANSSDGCTDTRPTDMLDYAAYFDLDISLRPDTETDSEVQAFAAARLRQGVDAGIALEPAAAAPRLSNFDSEHYSGRQLDQLSRWWDAEPANRIGLTRASDAEYERSRQAAARAMEYLREAAPELHGEVQILIRDIVIARPDGSNLMNYSGASSFALWGAITINAETQCDWIQFYRQIVHETGHNLLYAIARGDPLVKADRTVRRSSPIRADPRPIEGIFHAAFVLAREVNAFDALLQWHDEGGELPEDDVAIIADSLELSALAFWKCVETLREDDPGLTEFGDAVLADCEDYMKANFSLEPL